MCNITSSWVVITTQKVASCWPATTFQRIRDLSRWPTDLHAFGIITFDPCFLTCRPSLLTFNRVSSLGPTYRSISPPDVGDSKPSTPYGMASSSSAPTLPPFPDLPLQFPNPDVHFPQHLDFVHTPFPFRHCHNLRMQRLVLCVLDLEAAGFWLELEIWL